MKKLLFIIAFLAVSSLTFAQVQNISVKFVKNEPTKELITSVPGTKSIFDLYLNGTRIGQVNVSRYDNGGLKIENETNRTIKAEAWGVRKGGEEHLTPSVLGDGEAVSKVFGGEKFRKVRLKVLRVK